MLGDVVAIVVARAGEAQHAPGYHVAIAAVDRVGEEPFHRIAQHQREERLGVDAVRQLDLARLHVLEQCVLVFRRELGEALAVLVLLDPGVECSQPRPVTHGRRLVLLIALRRRSRLERSLHVEPRRVAEIAGELAIDIDCAAGVLAADAEVVGRDQPVDDRLDRPRLFGSEIGPAHRLHHIGRIGAEGLPGQGSRQGERAGRCGCGDDRNAYAGEKGSA